MVMSNPKFIWKENPKFWNFRWLLFDYFYRFRYGDIEYDAEKYKNSRVGRSLSTLVIWLVATEGCVKFTSAFYIKIELFPHRPIGNLVIDC